MDSYHHASAVIVGDKGVMMTGASGGGKSTLARRLIDYARAHGRFGALIGDDRIALELKSGRIIASGHKNIAGLIEIRGLGLAQTNFVGSAVIDLLVSCETVIRTRLPDKGERMITLMGVHVPRIETRPDDPESVWIALGYGHLTVQN